MAFVVLEGDMFFCNVFEILFTLDIFTGLLMESRLVPRGFNLKLCLNALKRVKLNPNIFHYRNRVQ